MYKSWTILTTLLLFSHLKSYVYNKSIHNRNLCTFYPVRWSSVNYVRAILGGSVPRNWVPLLFLTLCTWYFYQCKVQHCSTWAHYHSLNRREKCGLMTAGKSPCVCPRSFPTMCCLGFGVQTLTPRVMTTAPNFVCFDELVILITSDTEHGADAGICHLCKSSTECQHLKPSIQETHQYLPWGGALTSVWQYGGC